MRKYLYLLILALLLIILFFFTACEITTKRYGGVYNELGRVFVVEYHQIADKEGEWTRSRDNFKSDLERFYKLGYRLVSVNDLFNNSYVNIPEGKKPLVMTFDDGTASQFSYLIENGHTVTGEALLPKIDPKCAVAILDEFYKKHNDFGRAATFFLNSQPFYQKECPLLWKEKLKYLVKTGREIGNHTYNHDNLSELDYSGIKKTLAMQQMRIEEAIPSYEASSVALPFGAFPKKGKWLLQSGSYGGHSYKYKVAFLVGAAPTLPPYHKNFDPAMVQRVQASDSELTKWLGYIEKHRAEFYTSDGNPNVIAVQEKDLSLVDRAALKSGMKIRVCSGEAVLKDINIPSKIEKMKMTKGADRGVYYTFHSAGIKKRIDNVLNKYKETGLNTLVIDVKDVEGILGMDLKVPLAKKIGACDRIFVKDLKALIDELHLHGIRVPIRISVFKDRLLANKRSDLALKSSSGGSWREPDGVNWTNPFSEEVINYNIDIAEEAAKAGADEIQFDYIRFPEKGHVDNIALPKNKEKYQAIEAFLKKAMERLEPYNVSIAIDVFGVMAWLKDRDIAITGQRIGEMAKYVYTISPMLYPSHFDKGFNGHSDPAQEPYHFVYEGCKRMQDIVKGEDVQIVPWIQGFEWRVKNFNEQYVLDQVKAARDCGIDSFLVWNAHNRYDTTYSALRRK